MHRHGVHDAGHGGGPLGVADPQAAGLQGRGEGVADNEVGGHAREAELLGLLPHGTPHNSSSKRRRALQYHYAPSDAQPLEDQEERLLYFGSEGKDVSC